MGVNDTLWFFLWDWKIDTSPYAPLPPFLPPVNPYLPLPPSPATPYPTSFSLPSPSPT